MTGPIFETFGCRLNTYETEAMRDLAKDQTNTVVVNTCAVTAESVRQARQRIRKLNRENPGAKLVVTGCAAQTEPETFAAMPEVDHVLGNLEKMKPQTWDRLEARVQTSDIMSATRETGHLIDGLGTRARAYVQIQNGCDHRCTFCIIPYGRGNSRSVPAATVTEQIHRLTDRGYKEVVLTGVDLTSWGADLDGAPRLGDLVKTILRSTDVERLRLSSIDSIEADPDLIEAIATERRFMPHLHLSLQSGDTLILKRMKRRHSREDAVRFCETIRAMRPDIAFGADIIAGFPTETEDHFERSLALIEDCGLVWTHVFPFSPRQGTPAARMPQLSRQTVKARAARLRRAAEAAKTMWLEQRGGEEHHILMETPRMGRTESFAPVRFDTDHPVGEIVTATITGATEAHLIA